MEENTVKAVELAVTDLNTLDTCDLIRSQTERSEEFVAERPKEFADAHFALSLNDLRYAYNETAGTLNGTSGHEASGSVGEAENYRDVRIGKLWKTFNYEADRLSDTPEGKTAAANVHRLKKNYVGLAKWPVGRETEGIKALVKQARSDEFVEDFASLKMQGDVDALEAAQVEYERLYNLREADYAAKAAQASPKTQNLLNKMRTEYNFFIGYLEYLAYKYPQSAWPGLLAALNVKRTDYGAKLAFKGTLAEKEKANTPRKNRSQSVVDTNGG